MLINETSLISLYGDVHILAYTYHWHEDKIMNMGIKKRAMYKNLVIAQSHQEALSMRKTAPSGFDN